MITFETIRAALNDGELFLEYQPIVTLADRRCMGGEALVRWRRDDVVMTAGDFIDAVENTPMSGTLTYWVIDTVAEEMGDFLAAHRNAQIAINVPPEILGRGGLEYAATRSGLRAHVGQIILEITERGVPDRLGLDALNGLAERGVRLALDDTAISGANLALLARCKFEIIKIDKRLVAQLIESKPTPQWLLSIEALLKTSSLKVIAEGVESEHQAARLAAAGVSMGQGFLFSTSLGARDFMEYFG